MTREQFLQISFCAGMKVQHIDGNTYEIASVDFSEDLVGVVDGENDCDECGAESINIRWFRCENCEVIK